MGARGSRFTQNRFPLCLAACSLWHRHQHHYHHPHLLLCLCLCLCLLSKLCSQFTSDQVSALRFYANPMPMSCRRRGEPPFTPGRDRRGFHFPRVCAISSSAGLFQGNHFPSLFSIFSHTLSHVYRSCISFARLSSLVRHHRLVYALSFLSPLPPPLLSFYLDLVSRNSALTSIRGRSRR